jgi:hypothetical protein
MGLFEVPRNFHWHNFSGEVAGFPGVSCALVALDGIGVLGFTSEFVICMHSEGIVALKK